MELSGFPGRKERGKEMEEEERETRVDGSKVRGAFEAVHVVALTRLISLQRR